MKWIGVKGQRMGGEDARERVIVALIVTIGEAGWTRAAALVFSPCHPNCPRLKNVCRKVPCDLIIIIVPLGMQYQRPIIIILENQLTP